MTNAFIDGTGLNKNRDSNVFKLYLKYGGLYYAGPGSGSGYENWPAVVTLWDKVVGGAFGAGTSAIVDRAFEDIVNGAQDSVINLFGFSRGSFAIRMLAKKLCDAGFIVNFIGCFDTVGAMGIPVNFLCIPSKYLPWFLRFQEINLFQDAHVHKNVIRAAHAVALDDPRPAFKTTRMEPREGIVEKDFSGDHWKIGSGDESYKWMVEQFEHGKVN